MIDPSSPILMLACERANACACVKTLSDGKIWVISPYHEMVDYPEIEEVEIESAVCRHGYDPIEMKFDNLEKLKEFLAKTLISTRRAMGCPEPKSEDIKALIHFATPEMVVKILDRVENELIPKAEFEAAKNIMNDLVNKTPAVQTSPELQKRIHGLIAKCP
jgi:hypothetical protein